MKTKLTLQLGVATLSIAVVGFAFADNLSACLSHARRSPSSTSAMSPVAPHAPLIGHHAQLIKHTAAKRSHVPYGLCHLPSQFGPGESLTPTDTPMSTADGAVDSPVQKDLAGLRVGDDGASDAALVDVSFDPSSSFTAPSFILSASDYSTAAGVSTVAQAPSSLVLSLGTPSVLGIPGDPSIPNIAMTNSGSIAANEARQLDGTKTVIGEMSVTGFHSTGSVSAPEMDPSSTFAVVSLLLGGITVIRAKKRSAN